MVFESLIVSLFAVSFFIVFYSILFYTSSHSDFVFTLDMNLITFTIYCSCCIVSCRFAHIWLALFLLSLHQFCSDPFSSVQFLFLFVNLLNLLNAFLQFFFVKYGFYVLYGLQA